MKKLIYKLILCTIAIIAIAFNLTTSANAARPGSLDPSFGTAGSVITDILGNDRINDIAIQDDGKIVGVGISSGVADFMIVRYQANGTLDTTFNGDGIQFVDIAGQSDESLRVLIQNDSKILVVGKAGASLAVVRLNPDGSLDLSFDSDGKFVFPSTVFGSGGVVSAFKIQADGKIVITGKYFTVSGPSGIVVTRLNINGSLDTTFDTDGFVQTDVDSTTINDRASALDIDRSGKIVVVGTVIDMASSISKGLVIRYQSNGNLDTSFDTDGILQHDLDSGGMFEEYRQVLITDENKIILNGTNGNFAASRIVRLFANGSFDTNFNGDGIAPISAQVANNLAIQNDGKFVVPFRASSLESATMRIQRFTSNGLNDSTFGNGGSFDIPNINYVGSSAQLKSKLFGDKIIIAGAAGAADIRILRLNLSEIPTQTGDFDGDGFTDTAVYRPSTANWFVLKSSDNTTQISSFGTNGDIPLDGDFDGDGRNDLAIYRPSLGQWWFQRSSDNTVFAAQFGLSTDKPVPGDYDKDGRTDIAIYRSSTGEWLVLRSSSNFSNFFGYQFGASGDIPITRQGN